MAVVVSYNPIIPLLAEDLQALFGQLDRVVLIDNGSGNIGEIRALKGRFDRLQLIDDVCADLRQVLMKRILPEMSIQPKGEA